MSQSPALKAAPARHRAAYAAAREVPAAWVQLALVVVPLLVVPFFRLVDPDLWWHLKTGELIAQDGFLRHDPFSWTAAGGAWVTHEWLAEVLIYGVQAALGYWANALLFGAVAAASALVACLAGREAGAGTRAIVLCAAMAVAILGTYATVRPQAFSWLLFAVFFVVIQRSYRSATANSKQVWLLPPLMLLWANLHLGFFFGFGLLGAWCAALLWERLRGRDARIGQALGVSAACVVAACVHPEGPALLLYPLRYLSDAGATHAHVQEWQPPQYINPFHWPVFAGVALLGASLLMSRPRPFQLLVSIGIIALALQAVRNAPFLALLLPAIAAPSLGRTWRWASAAADADVRVPAGAAAALVGLTLTAAIAVMLSWNSHPSLREPDERNFPSAGAAFIEEHYAGRRLFNEYGWGGYLVYRLHPHTPVGIDGRTDFYGDRLMSEYYRIFLTEAGWEATLAAWDPEVVLVSRGSKLARALRDDPAWVEAMTAEHEAVFVRREIGGAGDGD